MDARQFSESLSDLSSRFLNDYARNAAQYARLFSGMKPSGSGNLAPDQLQQRYSEFLRTEGLQTLGKLVEAGMQFYTQVLTVGAEAANRYVEQVLLAGAAPPAAGSTGAPASKAPPVLLFRGKRGDAPSNAFMVSNNQNQSVDVSFDVSDMVSDDKGHRVAPVVHFTPERFELAPNAEQIVQCSIPLSENFTAGQMHHGNIRVVGFPEMTMQISVFVDETAAGRQPASAPTGEKPARKRPASRKKTAGKKKTTKKR